MRHDRSPESAKWQSWYSSRPWRIRRDVYLSEHPFCERCLELGKHEPSFAADHIEPHRGNWTKFISGELAALCRLCHDSGKQKEERAGYSAEADEDGWPISELHPANSSAAARRSRAREI